MSDQPKAAGTKFSQFGMTNSGPIDVVGLKDGQNIRATLTTDLVETNPGEAFRDAKGRFRSTADYSDLTNQLKVNRFIANELDLINGAIASLQAGSVVVQDDPPNIEADGQLWLDSNRLELFISYEGAWISTTPLAARVEQGEAVQAAIIEALDDGMREQTRLRSRIGDLESNSATKSDLDTKLGNSGEQMLAEGFWRVKQPNSNGGKSTFININDNVMHLYHVAYPESPEHAANMQYVDDQIAAIPAPESSSPAPLLWKYNSSVPADNLGNGEFNLSSSPTHGGAGDWYIYFSNRDARGQMWFPSDGGNSYTHEVGDHLATIRDRDAICCHGKTQKWYFNEGTNNYVRLKLSYYRKQFSLANGKYYLITVPGYMPFFPYSADAYSNGTHS